MYPNPPEHISYYVSGLGVSEGKNEKKIVALDGYSALDLWCTF